MSRGFPMKLLPSVLLNIVVVAGGLLVYDQLRDDGPAQVSHEAGRSVDLRPIEERLAALEAPREPLLRAQGADPRIVERLAALERRLPAQPPAKEEAARATEPRQLLARPATADAADEPSADEVERFRKLQAAAREYERANRDRIRIGKILAKADIALSPRQQDQLVQAYQAFQPRVREIWGEVKTRVADGSGQADWRTVIAETSGVLQEEFTAQISGFIPAVDAEVISQALHPRGK